MQCVSFIIFSLSCRRVSIAMIDFGNGVTLQFAGKQFAGKRETLDSDAKYTLREQKVQNGIIVEGSSGAFKVRVLFYDNYAEVVKVTKGKDSSKIHYTIVCNIITYGLQKGLLDENGNIKYNVKKSANVSEFLRWCSERK
jgi:hypothetical protein